MLENITKNKKILIAVAAALIIIAIGTTLGIQIYQKNKKAKEQASASTDTSSYDAMQKLLKGEIPGKKEEDKVKGKVLLADIQKKYAGIKTLYLETSITTKMMQNGKVANENTEVQKFWYMNPDKMMLKSSVNEIYSDGKKIVTYTPAIKQYDTNPYKEEFFVSLIMSSPAINTIGMIKGFDYSPKIISYEYVGEEEILGVKADVAKISLKMEGMGMEKPTTVEQKIWFAKDSGVILRNYYKMSFDVGGNKLEVESDAKAIVHKVNTEIKKSVFVFVPKKDMNKFSPAKDAKRIEEEMKLFKEMQEKNPMGKKVADFKLLQYVLEKVDSASVPAIESEPKTEDVGAVSENAEGKTPDAAPAPGETAVETPSENAPVETAVGTTPSNSVPNVEEPSKEAPKTTYKLAKTELSFMKDVTKGKKTVVAFWAYPDATDFLKSYQKFYDQNKDKYEIISINVNAEKDIQLVLEDFKALGYTSPVYFMSKETGMEIIKNWMVMGIPVVYFVDQNGIMKDSIFGGKLDSVTLKEKAASVFK